MAVHQNGELAPIPIYRLDFKTLLLPQRVCHTGRMLLDPRSDRAVADGYLSHGRSSLGASLKPGDEVCSLKRCAFRAPIRQRIRLGESQRTIVTVRSSLYLPQPVVAFILVRLAEQDVGIGSL